MLLSWRIIAKVFSCSGCFKSRFITFKLYTKVRDHSGPQYDVPEDALEAPVEVINLSQVHTCSPQIKSKNPTYLASKDSFDERLD